MSKRKLKQSSEVESPELDDAFFEDARPASEVVPGVVNAYKRSRGKQKAPTKKSVTIRLDEVVVEHYKAGGAGWQGRLNDDLVKIVAQAPHTSAKARGSRSMAASVLTQSTGGVRGNSGAAKTLGTKKAPPRPRKKKPA